MNRIFKPPYFSKENFTKLLFILICALGLLLVYRLFIYKYLNMWSMNWRVEGSRFVDREYRLSFQLPPGTAPYRAWGSGAVMREMELNWSGSDYLRSDYSLKISYDKIRTEEQSETQLIQRAMAWKSTQVNTWYPNVQFKDIELLNSENRVVGILTYTMPTRERSEQCFYFVKDGYIVGITYAAGTRRLDRLNQDKLRRMFGAVAESFEGGLNRL